MARTAAGIADCLLALAPHAGTRPVVMLLDSDHLAERVAATAQAAFPGVPVLWCPATDAYPGDMLGASAANAGARVAVLHAMGDVHQDGRAPVLIAGAEATLAPYAPPAAFRAQPPVVRLGDALDLAALRDTLIELGYRADERVDEPGEVGEAGVVLDIYPVAALQPVRLEVADGTLASIRRYDPVTQGSIEEVERQLFGIAAEPPAGPVPVDLLAHAPDALLLVDPRFAKGRARQFELTREVAATAPLIDAEAWDKAMAGHEAIDIAAGADTPSFAGQRKPMAAVKGFLDECDAAGRRVIIAGTERDPRFFARRLAKIVPEDALPRFDDLAAALAAAAPRTLVTLPLDAGTLTDDLVLLAAADLLGSRAQADHAVQTALADPLAVTLRLGDALVHEDFGVGILRGVQALALPGQGDSAVIELEYAKGGMRQVPILDAGKLWRYGGEGDAVKLDSLDGQSWAKRKLAIDEAIAETARHLRSLAKARAKATAPLFEPDATAYERFADGFAYGLTADQRSGIEAVRADLASGKPMDRLVVGDVGFGKTEVALRAAAMVALSGGQVAVVAPTTLLARQHLDEFTRRLKRVGVTVVSLSRANSAAEQKAARAALASGEAAVVIGTTAIAAKGTRFANLGLVIIDEEQRFGARQKAALEAMGAGHVLRLSATPIPRTLQSALIGLNQLSLITTPPARRVPVQTALGDFDPVAIRAALLREKARAGQSFVVVPRIEDLEPMQALLAELVPDQTVVTVHGKMGSAEADEALIGFANRLGDVLLATSIIETGLDVPRANTMVIVGCDRFGVGQLHQLRGRVGRSALRAYVLMMSAADTTLPDKARARLNQLVANTALGAGFAVAANDLDMRGAGDLSSDDQSGHLKLIGLELYQRLLTDTLRELAGEPPVPPLPRIETGDDALLPDDWIVDTEARLAAYVRIARIDDADALDRFADELEDRYGALPAPALTLLATRRLALQARAAGVARIQVGPAAIAFSPRDGTRLKPGKAQRESDGRILAPRDTDVPALDDAAEALAALG